MLNANIPAVPAQTHPLTSRFTSVIRILPLWLARAVCCSVLKEPGTRVCVRCPRKFRRGCARLQGTALAWWVRCEKHWLVPKLRIINFFSLENTDLFSRTARKKGIQKLFRHWQKGGWRVRGGILALWVLLLMLRYPLTFPPAICLSRSSSPAFSCRKKQWAVTLFCAFPYPQDVDVSQPSQLGRRVQVFLAHPGWWEGAAGKAGVSSAWFQHFITHEGWLRVERALQQFCCLSLPAEPAQGVSTELAPLGHLSEAGEPQGLLGSRTG